MLKRISVLIFTFFVFCLSAECFQENNISRLEYSKYGQSFDNESLSSRLNRLETDFFGTEQSGDLDSRLNKLSMMDSNTFQNPSSTFSNEFYPGEKKGVFKNFMDNITSAFDSGSFTGYTPSLMSGAYSNSYYTNGLFGYNNPHQSYCPYHNTFHNNSVFDGLLNKKFRSGNYMNRPPINHNFRHNRPYYNHSAFNPHRRYNSFRPYNAYNNPYRNVRRVYPQNLNTNFMTGSSVHIIRD